MPPKRITVKNLEESEEIVKEEPQTVKEEVVLKPKKPRSAAQLAALEKGRLKKLENLRLKKEAKPPEEKPKEEVQEEIKEQPKEEIKEPPKEEIKEQPKKEIKETPPKPKKQVKINAPKQPTQKQITMQERTKQKQEQKMAEQKRIQHENMIESMVQERLNQKLKDHNRQNQPDRPKDENMRQPLQQHTPLQYNALTNPFTRYNNTSGQSQFLQRLASTMN